MKSFAHMYLTDGHTQWLCRFIINDLRVCPSFENEVWSMLFYCEKQYAGCILNKCVSKKRRAITCSN